jgi:DNA-binding protein
MIEESSEEKLDESPDESPDEKPDKKSDERLDENTVYVGKKPTMNYVLAVVTQFNSGSPEIIIKARGRSISRAVDVAEIVRHRFVSTATVKDIRIDTEPLATEEGVNINVSSIEITLAMGK